MQKKMIMIAIISICIVSVGAGFLLFQNTGPHTPGVPSGFTAMYVSRTSINLTWIKGENTDTTYIERNTVSSWNKGEGILIYNGTGKNYQDTGLSPNGQYYYQAWGWNQTNNEYSPSVVSTDEPTITNQPPIIAIPNPANGSFNNLLNISWNIQINDPEGDAFTWAIQCSNGMDTAGVETANGTKTLPLTQLSYSTTYKIWVNATDSAGSGLFTRQWYTFTTKGSPGNTPPVFGTPSPINGSSGNQLNLNWSIPINDKEGNTFFWTIECSNGQDTGGASASNGTKTLALSGLSYSKTFKVWVNATDISGSGRDTIRWYTFTTKINPANSPPVFGTPSPINGSSGNQLNLNWSISISDPEGNSFAWMIECNNGQDTGGSGASNGTKTLALSGLSYSTTYKIWVNATDLSGGGKDTLKWYTFTTKVNPVNSPPVFGSPSPGNGSTGNLLNLTWSIPINDPEGNSYLWTIHCNNGQRNNGSGAVNGTKLLTLSNLKYFTSYTIWVNVTDPTGSGLYTRRWYIFTTMASPVNTPPVFAVPSPANGSTRIELNLSWDIPINDPEGDLFSWSIECNNSQTNKGTNQTNGTKSLLLTNLSYIVTYKIWVNATDYTGSHSFTRRWYTFTTKDDLVNDPPVLGKPTPTNNSNGNLVNFDWAIPINDPDGDTFTWTIECNNSQNNNGFMEYNGTKLIALTGLSYETTYTIWVNASDSGNSGRYTRGWYTFTTKANQPPQPPTITGPIEGKINVETEYTFTVTDDSDEVYYFIEWGDQTNSGWIGPYSSGEIVPVSHTWTKKGTYTITAKAKDTSGAESELATLSVTMPYSIPRPFQLFWERLFEWFPHAFPILRLLMGY